jgi:ABC-2 type transport system permease protein
MWRTVWRKNYIALQTMVSKETRRFMRVWIQTLLPPGITTLLYFLIFGHVIGSRIGMMQGVSYIAYIAPGLIMMNVISNSYDNTSSSFFQAKFFRSIEELLVSPIPNSLILLGFIAGGVMRGLAVAVVVTTVALFFTHLHIQHIFLMLVTVLLASIIFSLAGIINAIYARNFDDVSIIPTFVLTPLTYLGGVFYSVHALPAMWAHLSLFNPILYFVGLFRYSMLGVTDVNLSIAMGILGGMAVSLYLLAWILISKGVGIKA